MALAMQGPLNPGSVVLSIRTSNAQCSRPHFKSSIPTLQELCSKTILRYLSVANCVELFHYTKQYDSTDVCLDLNKKALEFMRESYEYLRDTTSTADLITCLGDEAVSVLENAVQDRQKFLDVLAAMRRGKVLERSCPPSGSLDQPAVSGQGRLAYAYETLQSNVAWPADVDAAYREAWLCASDFQAVFKMTYEEFKALPLWKQQRLKNEHMLF